MIRRLCNIEIPAVFLISYRAVREALAAAVALETSRLFTFSAALLACAAITCYQLQGKFAY